MEINMANIWDNTYPIEHLAPQPVSSLGIPIYLAEPSPRISQGGTSVFRATPLSKMIIV